MAAYTGPLLEMRTLESELELIGDRFLAMLTPAQREFYDIIHPPVAFLIHIFNDNVRAISQVYLTGPIPRAVRPFRGETMQTRIERKNSWGVEDIIVNLSTTKWIAQENWGLARQVKDSIDNQMAQAGYVFHYFEYVKADVTQIQAMMGELVLNPQNFENGSISILPENLYQPTLNNLIYDSPQQTSMSHDRYTGALIGTQLPNIKVYGYTTRYGWRKEDLIDAIKAAGLPTYGVLGVKGDKIYKQLPGFGKWGFMPSVYYETIYRKMFGTLDYVNWPEVCKTKLISEETVKGLARPVMDNYLKKLTYEQACELVRQQAEVNRKLKK